MFKIVNKNVYSEKVVGLEIEAPLIAKSRKAGHFVIVRVDKDGERIPLTISGSNIQKGTISLVIQSVGVTSAKLCNLNIGDEILDLVGPLGKATHIEKFGTVICAGGGVGVAPMLPIMQAMKEAGNRVISVLAGRNKNLIILEDEVRKCSDEVVIMTDDGSYGTKGLITEGIEAILNKEKVDLCVTIGPAIMMKFVSLLTQKYNIPTLASLNTIMVDGTGMCGACRVSVGGKTKFVCVDGPEFDAHQVDFDEMIMRMAAYKGIEVEAMEKYESVQSKIQEKDLNSTLRTNDDEWRKELRSAIKPKDRMAIPREKMPELDANYRNKNYEEVNIGYTLEQALTEAKRCLDCVNPTCMQGCPVSINIPTFIKNIERGEILEAAKVLKQTSSLPAVCGRVCPQERQCESKCTYLKTGKPAVAIGNLERFASDYVRESGANILPELASPNGIKIGVVGSGPCGLAFAGDMAKYGYDVTVFEALHEIGGVLKYGIPEFRLPNNIVDIEIENLERIGVKFIKNCIVGKTISFEDLKKEGYRAMFVASGAGLPNFMNIPGENLIGIMSSNEYLTRVNLMSAAQRGNDTPVYTGKNIAVIGGGNTAMDSVRTARRLGAERAMIIYRRSEEEMPARLEEIKHAKEEGIEFMTLCNPIQYRGDSKGQVTQMMLQKMRLGEPDASGRRIPEAIPGAVEAIDVDVVVVSVGVSPNPLIPNSVLGLAISGKGTIVVKEDSLQSSIPTIFAGGDIVRGGATVILAMGDGRKAAAAMHEKITQGEL